MALLRGRLACCSEPELPQLPAAGALPSSAPMPRLTAEYIGFPE